MILGRLKEKKSLVLDYGCGDGNFLLLFSPYFHVGYGIDISETRIDRARYLIDKNKIHNVDVQVMDAMNTDFEEQKIEYGIAILHHLDLNNSLKGDCKINCVKDNK